jgi:hypothetical protein
VVEELERREKKGEVGTEEVYSGGWDVLGEEEEVGEGEGTGKEDKGKGKEKSRHTEAALKEAEDAGRAAAEVSNLKNECETVN